MQNLLIKKWIKSSIIASYGLIKKDIGPKIMFLHDVHLEHKYCEQSMQIQDMQKRISLATNRGFCFVSQCPQKEGEVMLCFDDGYRGIYDCKDYFVKQKTFPVVFVAIELIGKKNYLTWSEILELHQIGFRFESHAWSHRKLTDVPNEHLCHELLDSRRCLEDHLQKSVNGLCFPLGYFNAQISDCALRYGYKELYSSIPGNADRRILPKLICRNLIQEQSEIAFVGLLYGGANFFWRHYFKQHTEK